MPCSFELPQNGYCSDGTEEPRYWNLGGLSLIQEIDTVAQSRARVAATVHEKEITSAVTAKRGMAYMWQVYLSNENREEFTD